MNDGARGGFIVGDVVTNDSHDVCKIIPGGDKFRIVYPNGYVPNEPFNPLEWTVLEGPSAFTFEPGQLVHDFEGGVGCVTKARDGVFLFSEGHQSKESTAVWKRWSPVYSAFGYTITTHFPKDGEDEDRETPMRDR